MADDDEVRNVVRALPIERLVGAPIDAMVKAQINASRQYVDYILQTCVSDGKARMAQFDFDETVVDTQGLYQGVRQRTLRVPLLATVTHPILAIQEGRVEFEVEITETKEVKQNSGGSRTELRGMVTHKSSQARSTDTRARYSFNTVITREDPPEAMMRVIDYLTDAVTKPAVMKANLDLKSTEQFPEEQAADQGGADERTGADE